MTEESTTLEERVEAFLNTELPQIKGHGGRFSIDRADADDGVVELSLAGACGTCVIAPMTINAIEEEMPKELAGVEAVHVKQEERGDGTKTVPTKTETMRAEMGEHYEDYDPPEPEHF